MGESTFLVLFNGLALHCVSATLLGPPLSSSAARSLPPASEIPPTASAMIGHVSRRSGAKRVQCAIFGNGSALPCYLTLICRIVIFLRCSVPGVSMTRHGFPTKILGVPATEDPGGHHCHSRPKCDSRRFGPHAKTTGMPPKSTKLRRSQIGYSFVTSSRI